MSVCIIIETNAWDLYEVLALIVDKEARNFFTHLNESGEPKPWSVSITLSAKDVHGRNSDNVPFRSKEYLVFNEADLVCATHDCVNDLRAKILAFGQQFEAIEVAPSSSSQPQQQQQTPDST